MATDLVAIRPPKYGLPQPDAPVLTDLPRTELSAWIDTTLGGPRYRVDQLFTWLHRRRARGFADMSDLPVAFRNELQRLTSLAPLQVDGVQQARDGTRKLRLVTNDGHAIESVLIPHERRGLTLCMSSQVGCSLTCRFCATASLGFVRNLATWEIVDQLYRAQDLLGAEAQAQGLQWPQRITNLVFMGMGEPLHNYNQLARAISIATDPRGAAIAGRRITVSTSGFVPGIERFAREGLGSSVGLAVSLNATTDETRSEIMPINTRWDIEALLCAVRQVRDTRRRVTFEYVLLRDVNDTQQDPVRLANLIGELRCHVNVIPFNPHPHAPYLRPTEQSVESFVNSCRRLGLLVYVRRPRGDDIAAACGQLALDARSSAA